MIKVNLVGNPNTGKTTLFNLLTGAHEHVGNWHGVTVEEKVSRYKFKNEEIELCDLPGLYSLTPLSYEEEVAADFILKNPDRLIVNICDQSNLQRNLYLTLSLLERGCKVILAVNQIEKRPLCKIDYGKLSQLLGIPVVAINAERKEDGEKLNQKILGFKGGTKYNLPYLNKLHLNEIPKVSDEASDFYKIKLLEGDEKICAKFSSSIAPQPEKVADARYDYIDQIMKLVSGKRERVYGQSKFDKILMNRFLAFPIFLGMLALVFYLTFFSFGAWLSDLMSWLLETCIGQPILNLLTSHLGQSSWVCGLFETAVIGGVGSILSFLPQVALLFFFLSILEDSGYLARVAFAIEDILGKVGLSGKSVYTLLMGFGCSTTAVLTARNMEDKNAKIKTGLLTPYMSCSAKFPIYSVLGGAFFGASNILVILGLYLLGVVVALIISLIFEKTVLKSKEQNFILEFPPYHAMSAKRVARVLFDNVKSFVLRVGSLIVAMNVIVWVLGNFTFTFKYIPSSGGVSILETLGKIFAPIFIPLGFGSWAPVSALLAGLVAKEVIISSLAMFNGASDAGAGAIANSFHDPASAAYFASGASVISYLVFCLLYFPCLATTSVLSKEIGRKWTAIGIIVELIVAYITAWVVYTLARTIESFGAMKVLLTLLGIFVIILSVIFVWRRLKKKKACPFSSKCKKNCAKAKKEK